VPDNQELLTEGRWRILSPQMGFCLAAHPPGRDDITRRRLRRNLPEKLTLFAFSPYIPRHS
jgi:hypothetical protein